MKEVKYGCMGLEDKTFEEYLLREKEKSIGSASHGLTPEEYVNGVDARVGEASQKVRERFNSSYRRFLSTENSENKFIFIAKELVQIVKNPDDPMRIMYSGWNESELKELYFVLTGKQME